MRPKEHAKWFLENRQDCSKQGFVLFTHNGAPSEYTHQGHMAGSKGLNQGITEAKFKGSLSLNHIIDTAQWYSACLASSGLWIHSPVRHKESREEGTERGREEGKMEESVPDQLEEESITTEIVW